MKIQKNIQELFEQIPIMILSTANNNGIPNAAPIGSKKIINNDTIITIDTFHKKTIANILENPNVAIAMWKDYEAYQIKGTAKYYTSGDIFESGKEWILKLKPQKIVKGVIEIKVAEIYYLIPSYELAGKKV